MKTEKHNHLLWVVTVSGYLVQWQRIAEQFNDENGLVWPKAVAPFHVHVIPVNMKSDAQREMGENIYNSLQEQGYEVLLDDRAERAGVKFADADLFGLPVRVTVGKKQTKVL